MNNLDEFEIQKPKRWSRSVLKQRKEQSFDLKDRHSKMIIMSLKDQNKNNCKVHKHPESTKVKFSGKSLSKNSFSRKSSILSDKENISDCFIKVKKCPLPKKCEKPKKKLLFPCKKVMNTTQTESISEDFSKD